MSTDPLQPPPPRRAFWNGLTTPSRGSVATILITTIAGLAVAVYLLSPQVLQHATIGYFMENNRDNGAYVTLRAFQLRASAPPPEAAITVIGTSVFLNDLLLEEDAEKILARYVSTPHTVENLSCGGQSLWDIASVIDYLGLHTGSVVIIDVSPVHLSQDRAVLDEPRRFGVPTSVFEEERAIAGLDTRWQTGILPIDQREFFSTRLKTAARRLLKNRPIPMERMERYTIPGLVKPNTANTQKLKRLFSDQFKKVSKLLERGHEHYPANLAAVARMIERRRALGPVEFVLVEAPRHPDFERRANREHLKQYRQAVESFALKHKVHYWDLTDEIDIKRSDMRDLIHISNPAARRRFTQGLMRRTADLLNARETP